MIADFFQLHLGACQRGDAGDFVDESISGGNRLKQRLDLKILNGRVHILRQSMLQIEVAISAHQAFMTQDAP